MQIASIAKTRYTDTPNLSGAETLDFFDVLLSYFVRFVDNSYF
jgi:anaerobic ribonucleoside-triphosphate reductase